MLNLYFGILHSFIRALKYKSIDHKKDQCEKYSKRSYRTDLSKKTTQNHHYKIHPDVKITHGLQTASIGQKSIITATFFQHKASIYTLKTLKARIFDMGTISQQNVNKFEG